MLPSCRFFLLDVLKLKIVNCKYFLFFYAFIINIIIIVIIILLLLLLLLLLLIMHLMYIFMKCHLEDISLLATLKFEYK